MSVCLSVSVHPSVIVTFDLPQQSIKSLQKIKLSECIFNVVQVVPSVLFVNGLTAAQNSKTRKEVIMICSQSARYHRKLQENDKLPILILHRVIGAHNQEWLPEWKGEGSFFHWHQRKGWGWWILSLRIRTYEEWPGQNALSRAKYTFAELGHVPLDLSWACRVSTP